MKVKEEERGGTGTEKGGKDRMLACGYLQRDESYAQE